MELYFAYGSNLWLGQMRERCPSTQVEGAATLAGHRLWFPLQSQRWGAGVASIRAEANAKTEGVLYRISRDDLHVMDGYEGVERGMYRRVELPVSCAGVERHAWMYIGRIEDGAPFPTSRAYIDTILRGAREHGLDADWIRYLQDFPVID